jgi:hypothetical protein
MADAKYENLTFHRMFLQSQKFRLQRNRALNHGAPDFFPVLIKCTEDLLVFGSRLIT